MLRIMIGFFLAVVLATGAHAQGTYRIKSGDSLQIEVLEDPNLNRNVLVLPDGTITFPLVGTLPAAGRSVDDVRAALISALAPNFAADPNVFVSMAALSQAAPALTSPGIAPTLDMFIMGEVANPGKFAVTPGVTLLQFIAEAGGLTRFAAKKRIELRRTDPDTGAQNVYLFNYLGTGGGSSIKGNTTLQAGDVVVVPQRRLFE